MIRLKATSLWRKWWTRTWRSGTRATLVIAALYDNAMNVYKKCAVHAHASMEIIPHLISKNKVAAQYLE